MGGAPRNPAPRNHVLARIVEPSGCHCTDAHMKSTVFTEDQQKCRIVPTPLRSTSPFSDRAMIASIVIIAMTIAIIVIAIIAIISASIANIAFIPIIATIIATIAIIIATIARTLVWAPASSAPGDSGRTLPEQGLHIS